MDDLFECLSPAVLYILRTLTFCLSSGFLYSKLLLHSDAGFFSLRMKLYNSMQSLLSVLWGAPMLLESFVEDHPHQCFYFKGFTFIFP